MRLSNKVKELEEALEFYANSANYVSQLEFIEHKDGEETESILYMPMLRDKGEIARRALGYE